MKRSIPLALALLAVTAVAFQRMPATMATHAKNLKEATSFKAKLDVREIGGAPVTVEVGPIPHHLGFVGATLVVAVNGSGQAVLIKDGQVVATSQLTSGLHGVAVVELMRPLAVFD